MAELLESGKDSVSLVDALHGIVVLQRLRAGGRIDAEARGYFYRVFKKQAGGLYRIASETLDKNNGE